MERPRFDTLAASLSHGLSRRAALLRLGGGGVAAGLLGAVGLERRSAAAQSASPAAASVSWETLHLEVDFQPHDPVSITRAGSGPPQRGDWFAIDGEIYAKDQAGGAVIGFYQCFGAWTAAGTAADAPNQRLTTVQYHLKEGSLMGLINEGGPVAAAPTLVGAVSGGTGDYAHASGTFTQVPAPANAATPAPSATPLAGPPLQRATFDLLLPKMS